MAHKYARMIIANGSLFKHSDHQVIMWVLLSPNWLLCGRSGHQTGHRSSAQIADLWRCSQIVNYISSSNQQHNRNPVPRYLGINIFCSLAYASKTSWGLGACQLRGKSSGGLSGSLQVKLPEGCNQTKSLLRSLLASIPLHACVPIRPHSRWHLSTQSLPQPIRPALETQDPESVALCSLEPSST